MPLALTSAAFGEGGIIPIRHTCDGDDRSPPLAWQGAPPHTRSFVLLCTDPDAPAGIWHHWAVFDLPADLQRLDAGIATDADTSVMRQALNDFGRRGYSGPCPPKHDRPHHYRFHLLALSAATLALPQTGRCSDVERAAAAHILAEAVLTGIYSRAHWAGAARRN